MIPSKQPKTPGASEKVTVPHNFFSKIRSTHAEIDAHWEQAVERVKKVGGVASFYLVAGYLRAWGDEKKLLDWHLSKIKSAVESALDQPSGTVLITGLDKEVSE